MNFATLQGLTIPEGAVTQIADESGNVIWKKEKIVGTFVLRPSADISVGHNLYPTDISAAYLLINEEESDDDATYIASDKGEGAIATSKFALSTADLPAKRFMMVTAVRLYFDPYASSTTNNTTAYNEFILEVNGNATGIISDNTLKGLSSVIFSDAIPLINEAMASNGSFPTINLTVISHGGEQTGTTKVSDVSAGISQAYLSIAYEA